MNDDVRLPDEIPQTSTADGSLSATARAQIDLVRNENRLVRLDLDDLREENRRLRAATVQMRAEIVLLSRALEPMHRLHEELEARRAEVDILAGRLAATYASTSWRLTRLVRLLSRKLRRQRGPDWPDR
jgi:hypothetical protein